MVNVGKYTMHGCYGNHHFGWLTVARLDCVGNLKFWNSLGERCERQILDTGCCVDITCFKDLGTYLNMIL